MRNRSMMKVGCNEVLNPGPEEATVFLELMQVKEPRDWKAFVDPSLMEELARRFPQQCFQVTRL
jgi:hypothetical protein